MLHSHKLVLLFLSLCSLPAIGSRTKPVAVYSTHLSRSILYHYLLNTEQKYSVSSACLV